MSNASVNPHEPGHPVDGFSASAASDWAIGLLSDPLGWLTYTPQDGTDPTALVYTPTALASVPAPWLGGGAQPGGEDQSPAAGRGAASGAYLLGDGDRFYLSEAVSYSATNDAFSTVCYSDGARPSGPDAALALWLSSGDPPGME